MIDYYSERAISDGIAPGTIKELHMSLQGFKVGCCVLEVDDNELERSCLSMAVTEDILLTPHGIEIPILYRVLEKWQQGAKDSEMIGAVRAAKSLGSQWGYICSNRDVHGPDKENAPFWFCSGPVSVFLKQARVREVFKDLKDILAEAKLKPENFSDQSGQLETLIPVY